MSFNTKKQHNFDPEDFEVTDFPWDNPLRMVAEQDMALAIAIVRKYGGVNMYVPQFETICDGPKRRMTVRFLKAGEKTVVISEKTGFSQQKVRQIRRDELPEDGEEQPA